MEMNINIEDYLTKDEMKEIAKEQFSAMVKQQFSKAGDIERVITNLSYEFLFRAVSDAIGEDSFNKIKNKVEELLEDDSHIQYLLWRKKHIYESDESPAITILNKAIKDNQEKIENKVSKFIDEYDFSEAKDEIYDVVCNSISEKLFGK